FWSAVGSEAVAPLLHFVVKLQVVGRRRCVAAVVVVFPRDRLCQRLPVGHQDLPSEAVGAAFAAFEKAVDMTHKTVIVLIKMIEIDLLKLPSCRNDVAVFQIKLLVKLVFEGHPPPSRTSKQKATASFF